MGLTSLVYLGRLFPQTYSVLVSFRCVIQIFMQASVIDRFKWQSSSWDLTRIGQNLVATKIFTYSLAILMPILNLQTLILYLIFRLLIYMYLEIKIKI